MNKDIEEDFLLEPEDRERLACLAGPGDENLRQLEKRLGLRIAYSGAHFHLEGRAAGVKSGKNIIKNLYIETFPLKGERHPAPVTPDMVHLAITESVRLEQSPCSTDEPAADENGTGKHERSAVFKLKHGYIRARTPNQCDYITKIRHCDVCFGVGPAGTGKTYLAVAAAVEALESSSVRRIILTRPAVEAGEKLGFLPGDLSQKVDPYLRPLYDALFEMLGFEKVEKLIGRSVIEIAPLAYMRGRTLNDSFIIMDEAQNTTMEQMKMFLTRIGFNSKAVINGDPSQTDLPRHVRSGLKNALKVLEGVPQLGFTFFNATDVVRHPVVAAIVNAYERYERSAQADEAARKLQAAKEHSDTLQHGQYGTPTQELRRLEPRLYPSGTEGKKEGGTQGETGDDRNAG